MSGKRNEILCLQKNTGTVDVRRYEPIHNDFD